MVLRLSLRRTRTGTLVLSYPLPGRVVFGSIGAFLASGMLVVGEFSLPVAVLALVGFLTALYDDIWVFDKGNGRIIRRTGFPFLYRKRDWPVEALKSVLLRIVTGPGAPESASPFDPDPGVPHLLRKGRAVLLLEMEGVEPRRIVLEDGSHRDRESLEAIGRGAASYCGIPFIE